MTSPTSPPAFAPESLSLCWGVESVTAGTAATVIQHEVCRSVLIRYMPANAESSGYRNASVTRGKSYRVQQHAEIDITVDYHSAGIAAFALGAMCGNASEGAVTGTTPKTHPFTPNALSNRMNTFTLWADYGDHNHVQKMTFCTLSAWSFSSDPNTLGTVTMTFVGRYPTYSSTVTPTNFVGSTANYPITPILGSQGTYTIFNGAGSPAAYTNNVLGCTLSLARTVTPLPNAAGKDPNDFNSNELVFSGSMSYEWDGFGTNTPTDDAMQYANLGTSGSPNVVSFTNADGHGFSITFYYLRWTEPTYNFGGSVITADFAFTTEHDESQLDIASPILTAPKSISILNALATPMTT